MIGLIITGHGHFASGLLSAAEVIAGQQDKVRAIDFLTNDSSESLQEKIMHTVREIQCESVLFLTDIAGGTPFNQSVLISSKAEFVCRIFSGTNMPLLLEAIFGLECGNIDDLVESLLQSDQSKIQLYTETKRVRVSQKSSGI